MKKLLINIKNWFIKIKPSKRKVIQLYTALLYNANLKGFIKGEIFTGSSKGMCVPGLNCYSCPGAVGACPLGSLQGAISNSNKSLPFYVFGIIMLYGLIFGRTVCGWLCPVGFVQELLFKIRSKKLGKSKYTRLLSYLKYVLLVIFVFIIPFAYSKSNLPVPGFCKYICPAGIFEGAFFLLGHQDNVNFFTMLGPLFTWKFFIFALLFVACIFIYRCFCRFICPLGAIYGFFNKYSLLGVKVDDNACINCGKCVKECKMDIRVVGDHECIQCGECISVCPTKAIVWKGNKFILPKNEIEINNEVVNEEVVVPKKNKKKLYKLLTQIGATLLLVSTLVYAYFGDDKGTQVSEVAKIGEICAEFEITSRNGKELLNNETAKGKVTFLNFWNIDCSSCIAEIPHFEKFYREYKEDVNFVAINPTDSNEEIDTFIYEMYYQELNIYWDEFEMNIGVPSGELDLEKYFAINNAFPFTAILDKDLVIRELIFGSLDIPTLKEYYNKYK